MAKLRTPKRHRIPRAPGRRMKVWRNVRMRNKIARS